MRPFRLLSSAFVHVICTEDGSDDCECVKRVVQSELPPNNAVTLSSTEHFSVFYLLFVLQPSALLLRFTSTVLVSTMFRYSRRL